MNKLFSQHRKSPYLSFYTLLALTCFFSPHLHAEKHLSQLIMTEIQNEIAKSYSLQNKDFDLTTKKLTKTKIQAPPQSPIEAQLKANREKLKKRNLPHNRGKDIIAAQLEANREKLRLRRKAQKKVDVTKPETFNGKMRALHKEAFNKLKGLKRYEQSTLMKWKSERDAFLKQLPKIKKTLINIPIDSKPVPDKVKKKLLTKVKIEPFHIIPGAFENKISHQAFRPTCAAFAGVRAIEILAKQQGRDVDLSEQYFYWSSKPDCHSRKCSKRGSWVTNGFDYSMNTRGSDIPLANTCAYSQDDIKNNQTQIPLAKSCSKGVARVRGYERLRTINELYQQLNNNKPVILGLTLSENFFNNKGHVFSSQATKQSHKNEHALGHAVVAVGHMSLPEKLHNKEGKVCFIVANSWGRGWGKGGYSCLSEKWLSRFRNSNNFIALTKVSI